MLDFADVGIITLLPDQVFPSFLVGVDLWGRSVSTQRRLRQGRPELIHHYCLPAELGQTTRLHMVYSDAPSGLSLGSLRVAAIREPNDEVGGNFFTNHQRGERTKLTLNACLAGLDTLTNEALIGYIDYTLEFQEPISGYLQYGDSSTLVGNNIEGLVGTNSSRFMTGGRHNLYGWDLVEAMVKRDILPTNGFIEGQLNIPAVLHHILLGNQVTSW